MRTCKAKIDRLRSIIASALSKYLHELLPFSGLGLYWGWIWSTFFSNLNAIEASEGIFALRPFGIVSMAAMLLVMLVSTLTKRDHLSDASPKMLFLFPLSATAGTLLLGLADSFAMRLAASGLAGIGGAVLLILWGRLSCLSNVKAMTFQISFSLIVSAAAFFLAMFIPSPLRLLFVAALPIASYALSHTSWLQMKPDENEVQEEAERSYGRYPWKLGIALFACGAGLGFVSETTMAGFEAEPDFTGSIISLGDVIVAVTLLAFYAVRKQSIGFSSAYVVVPPLVILAIILMTSTFEHSPILAFLCARIAFNLFDGLVWIQMPRISLLSLGRDYKVFSFTRLMLDGGMIAGSMVLYLMPPDLLLQSSMVGIGVSFILLIALSVSLHDHDVESIWMEEPDAQGEAAGLSIDDVCSELAEQYGLTPREAEIAKLIILGYGAKEIKVQLGIEMGTVQTHMKNIYRKCDVHSRQEITAKAIEMLSSDPRTTT